MSTLTYKKEILPVVQGTWLVNELDISFVSACAQGANPGAKVMLKKEKNIMADDGNNTDNKTAINIDMDGLTKSLSTEVQSVVAGLLEKKDSLSAEIMTDAVIASMAKSLITFKADIEKGLEEQVVALKKEMNEELAKTKNSDVGKEDAVLKMGEHVFRKSEVGAAAFDALAYVHKQQEESEARIRKEKLEMRVEKEYPHIAGKAEDKALLLKAIEDLPENAKNAGLNMLKQLNSNGENFTKEFGHNGNTSGNSNISKALPSDTDASLQLDKMAADFAKEKGITKSAAYNAVLQTPEGRDLYEQHRLGA